ALGIRPGQLPDAGPGTPVVFNGSLMGSGPIMELLCLHRLLADGIRPRWVLVECWPPYWNQQGEHNEVRRLPVPRLACPRLPLVAGYIDGPRRLYEQWLLARSIPWSSSRFVLLTQWARTWLTREIRRDDMWVKIDPWGWLPYQGGTAPEEGPLRLVTAHRTIGPMFDDYTISET